MSLPVDFSTRTKKKRWMLDLIRDRLKGYAIRQLIREEIRRRGKNNVRELLVEEQLEMFR